MYFSGTKAAELLSSQYFPQFLAGKIQLSQWSVCPSQQTQESGLGLLTQLRFSYARLRLVSEASNQR